MPNRIIKESICRSDSVNALSWFEEVLFYRLIVNCDDYGRFDARPAIIKGSLFPLKTVTNKQIENALNKLSTVGIVYLYEVDGKPYLQFVTWGKHQRIRNVKEKYPAPNDKLPQVAASCRELRPESNPIQSESNPNPNPNPNSPKLFDEFWNAYPRKVAKVAAEKAFNKLKVDEPLLNKMLTAIEQQSKSAQWKKDDGQFIPHPATWLNQARWEDKPNTPRKETSFDLDEYEDMVRGFVPRFQKKERLKDDSNKKT